MRKLFRIRAVGATVLALALVASACGDDDASGDVPDGPTITVGSTNFGEQLILGEIYAQALEKAGYPVERSFNLGSREVVNPALKSGEIDLLAEYTGTLLTFEGGTSSTDSQETYDALVAILEDSGLTAADYAPAQDKNGIVVTAEFAAANGVSTTSDLAALNGTLVLGGPPECPNREFCLIGLQDVYGLDFAEFKPLDVGGPLTVAAREGGEIDGALRCTADIPTLWYSLVAPVRLSASTCSATPTLPRAYSSLKAFNRRVRARPRFRQAFRTPRTAM